MNLPINQVISPLSYLLSNYTDLAVGHDIKEKSRKRYMYDAENFISFVVDNGFNEKTLLLYKVFLESRTDIKSETKKGKLRIAKQILERMFYKGILTENYSPIVKNFKTNKGHKKLGLDTKDIKALFDYLHLMPEEKEVEVIRGKQKFLKKIKTNKERDLLTTTLLAYQGFRKMELCSLQIENINLISGTAIIKGKARDDEELVYLHPKSVLAIKRYLAYTNRKTGFLLLSRLGRRFSESSLGHIFKGKKYEGKSFEETGLFYLVGIDKTKTTHGFRHWFITSLLEKFNDINTVMKFARLKTLETVKVYDDRREIESLLPDYYKALSLD